MDSDAAKRDIVFVGVRLSVCGWTVISVSHFKIHVVNVSFYSIKICTTIQFNVDIFCVKNHRCTKVLRVYIFHKKAFLAFYIVNVLYFYRATKINVI